MNVNESLTTLLQIEARLDALKESRSRLRAELEAEARKQWEDQGAAPTYRIKGVGTASLSGADSWTSSVIDPEAWAGWVLQNHPTEAEHIIRVPATISYSDLRAIFEAVTEARRANTQISVSTEVRPLILKALADKSPIIDPSQDAQPLWSGEGEAVPGVVMRRGSPHLAIRFDFERRRAVTAQEMHALGMGEPTAEELDESFAEHG